MIAPHDASIRRRSTKEIRMRLVTLVAAVLLSVAGPARPADQVTVDKTVPFELDHWYALDARDGPVTLHRIHLERQAGPGLKARVVHNADEEWTVPIKIEIEYSN